MKFASMLVDRVETKWMDAELTSHVLLITKLFKIEIKLGRTFYLILGITPNLEIWMLKSFVHSNPISGVKD